MGRDMGALIDHKLVKDLGEEGSEHGTACLGQWVQLQCWNSESVWLVLSDIGFGFLEEMCESLPTSDIL